MVGVKREVLTADLQHSSDIDKRKLNGLRCEPPRRLSLVDLLSAVLKKRSFSAKLGAVD